MDIIQQVFITDRILKNKFEFRKENLNLALSRMRIICIGILFFSIYYFYADFILLKDANKFFRLTLIYFHLIGFLLSALFLLLYKNIKKRSNNVKFLRFIHHTFIIILLLMGSLPIISNQVFTGNIDAYIVVVFIAAVAFPFELEFMLASLILNHIIFLFGISKLSNNYLTLASKQINSSAMLTAAILFCYSLYRNRILEFNNRHRLIESEYIFEKLASVNPLPLYIARHEDGEIIMSSEKSHDFFGYSKEEFTQISANDLYVNWNDRAYVLDKLNDLRKIGNHVVEQKCKDGIRKWVVANYELIHYSGEDYILTSVTDITEMKKFENELLNHASIDSLTGVLNRRTGIESLKDKLNLGRREQVSLSICFIDIDNLKSVNDIYGHNEGDILIKTVCNVLKNNISNTDIFFRYGGDEFVVLFPNKNETYVEAIWMQIENNFKKINSQGQKPYNISASHGLFELDSSSNYTIEEILHLADKKMYLEKKMKRECR